MEKEQFNSLVKEAVGMMIWKKTRFNWQIRFNPETFDLKFYQWTGHIEFNNNDYGIISAAQGKQWGKKVAIRYIKDSLMFLINEDFVK